MVDDGAAGSDTKTETGFITVVANPTVSITSTTDASCYEDCDGAATAAGVGGSAPYNYSWSGGQTSASIASQCAGSYDVSVTDANGCSSSTVSATIGEPTAITVTSTPVDASCGNNNGSVTISASGGTSGYTYSLNGGTAQAGNSFTGLAVGSYSVEVEDANGCTETTSFNISNPNAPTAAVSGTNVACNAGCDGSASATVTGGTAPYTYSWTSGGNAASETGLCAGSYTVTVTDANNCVVNENISITEPTVLSLSETHVDETTGNDGSIDLSVSGGTAPYTYSWTGGVTTEDLNGLAAGTYDVTVTDANGCTETLSVTILSSVGIEEQEDNSLVVYPNPSDGNFLIYIGPKFESNVMVNIYTMEGRLVYSQQHQNNAAFAIAERLSPAVYVLEVTDSNVRELKRVIVK